MVTMTGAKACIETLKQEGTEVVFGLPGGAILPFYNELKDSGIRQILVRHEQAAAHMADGYARITDRPGVCVATSGPGALNLVTGIATAYMDSSPLIAITGQVALKEIGRDTFQEADITGITAAITKHNFEVVNPSEVPSIVRSAFYIAKTGRPGPVLVDMPKDVQMQEADMIFPGEISLPAYRPRSEPHRLQVKRAIDLLEKAKRPLILAGGGVIISNASQELVNLAEHLGAPVALTFMGKGAIPASHPLSLGKIGVYGASYSNQAISDADLVLAVGVRFADRATGSLREFAKNASIIQIDLDPSEIGKNVDVDIPIVGDAKKTLEALHQNLKRTREKNISLHWAAKKDKFEEQETGDEIVKDIKPAKLFKLLRELLPKKSITTVDVGQHQMWAAIYFDIYNPKTFISSGGLGTMGFGLPAALGAKVARPDVPVVNITGDGSFLMSEHELATSVEEKIPVIVIILNNRLLGMVAQLQRFQYNNRVFAVDLGNTPDFMKLADAYHAHALRAESYKEVEKAVKEALSLDTTTVIDVPINPEENVRPVVSPGGGLTDLQWGG